MLSRMKKLVKRLVLSYRCDSESYIKRLRDGGAEIGERVRIFDPVSTVIDATRPWMIKIGDDVQIAAGVTILTHGYDWSVLKRKYGEVLGSCGDVVIGNNCFIGVHTTILKGTHIGDDCIIGANSVVTKDIPSGMVAVGNPAKPVMSVEEYYQKRKDAQLQEAEQLYEFYVKRMGKEPEESVFDEFFWLFRMRAELPEGKAMEKMKLLGNYEMTHNLFATEQPMFDGYEAFLDYLHRNKG